MSELVQAIVQEAAQENPNLPIGMLRRYIEAGHRAAQLEMFPRRKQAGLDDLIGEFQGELAALTSRLEAGEITVAVWRSEIEALIARYHLAALMLGRADTALARDATSYLVTTVAMQYEFLSAFGVEIQDADEWQAGFNARAEQYAGSIKEPYWTGETQMLPLPAMPAQGTQCLTNCGCSWKVQALDEAAGDFDAYWRRSKEDSCETCLEREAAWSPVEIRGWELR